jgi:hypothetical protein
MKHKLFIFAIAGLGLASCSSDEVTSTLQDDSIEFRTGMGTRASETTVTTLNSGFGVLALKGDATSTAKTLEWQDVFKHTDNTGIWKSDDAHSWPKYRLNFYAYYPSDASLIGSTTGATVNLAYSGNAAPIIQNFAPKTSPSDQVDFVYATNGGLRSDFTSVPLTFKHGLAQIAFKAKNENENYTVKVIGTRIGYVTQKGDFKYPSYVTTTSTTESTSSLWTFATNPDKVNFEGIFESSPVSLGTDALDLGTPYMIIPQSCTKWTPDENTKGAYLAVLVQIVGTGKATAYPANEVLYPKVTKYKDLPAGYGWAAVPITADWQPGYKYTYILDFTDGAGKVDPDKPDPDKVDPSGPDPDPDPLNPGDDILTHDITFKVTVQAWTEITATNAPMDEAITNATTTSAPADSGNN